MKIQTMPPTVIGSDLNVSTPKANAVQSENEQTTPLDGFNIPASNGSLEAETNNSLLSQREAVSLYMLFGGEQPAEQKFYGQNKAVQVNIGNFIDVAG